MKLLTVQFPIALLPLLSSANMYLDALSLNILSPCCSIKVEDQVSDTKQQAACL